MNLSPFACYSLYHVQGVQIISSIFYQFHQELDYIRVWYIFKQKRCAVVIKKLQTQRQECDERTISLFYFSLIWMRKWFEVHINKLYIMHNSSYFVLMWYPLLIITEQIHLFFLQWHATQLGSTLNINILLIINMMRTIDNITNESSFFFLFRLLLL